MGPFFAWQILCDLLESQILGTNTDNQWACLGPGAHNGLRRIFRLETTKGELKHTRLLRDICSLNGRKSGFVALGLEFPAFLHKPLSLKNSSNVSYEKRKPSFMALEQMRSIHEIFVYVYVIKLYPVLQFIDKLNNLQYLFRITLYIQGYVYQ